MAKNPQKILNDRYMVVPRSIILLIKNGQVLLQKATETKKLFPGFYNGIGGHIERGENPLDGARRELLEEAGITCENLVLTGSIAIDVNEQQGILLFVFTGDLVHGDIKASEEGDLYWIDLAEVGNLKVVEDIPEMIVNIRKSLEIKARFFASYRYDVSGTRVMEITWDLPG